MPGAKQQSTEQPSSAVSEVFRALCAEISTDCPAPPALRHGIGRRPAGPRNPAAESVVTSRGDGAPRGGWIRAGVLTGRRSRGRFRRHSDSRCAVPVEKLVAYDVKRACWHR